MERLKSILADKVLDLSSESGDAVKVKIDKIQRFRDFANALKSLMVKYPTIEDELIAMIEDGDFDTKVASSRVDTVIRLADTEAAQTNRITPIQIIHPIEESLIEEETDALIEEDLTDNTIAKESELIDNDDFANYINPDNIPMEIYEGSEESLYEPEDIDDEVSDESSESEDEYASYTNIENEDVSISEKSNIDNPEIATEQMTAINTEDEQSSLKPDTGTEAILESKEEDQEENITEEEKAAKRKVIIKRIVQVIGIILAVVIIVFIVKFVMSHWQAILIIGGIVIVLIILFVWLKRKR